MLSVVTGPPDCTQLELPRFVLFSILHKYGLQLAVTNIPHKAWLHITTQATGLDA